MGNVQRQDIPVYQLKVILKGSNPPIWRRIHVRGDISLGRLHDVLQIVMGWTDTHLHQFIIGRSHYGVPDPDDLMEVKNERRYKLMQIAPREKMKFLYEYDFGDGWEHEILVEKILHPEQGAHYPVCLAGKRACPPEDVGGVFGYEDFLEAIRDPNNPEHDNMLEWVGGEFDPEAFDLDSINQVLGRIR